MPDIEELKKTLANHEKRIVVLEKNIGSASKVKKQKSGKTSIMDLILEVKTDGFFDKPKFHSDILEKFEEMGHIYGTNSINAPLSRALKSRVLGRKKITGKWGYVKR